MGRISGCAGLFLLLMFFSQISDASSISVPASEDPSIASSLASGRAEYDGGRYSQAAEIFRGVISRLDNQNEPGPELVEALGNLASALIAEQHYDESEMTLTRAIAILRSEKPNYQKQLPVLLGTLGRLYQETERFQQAETTMREALKLGDKLLKGSPEYLSGLHNVWGVLHLRMGDQKRAESDFRKALSLIEQDNRENDLRRPQIMANLAVLYSAQQKWGSAEKTLLRAIHDIEHWRGMEHPELCALLSNLSFVYFNLQDFAQAEVVLRRNLAIHRAVFGSESAPTAAASVHLAELLATRGTYGEAAQLFTDALRVQERELGRRHSDVATTLELFADLLRKTNETAKSEEMEGRAASIRLETDFTISISRLPNVR
jgi:tetratricopeptide (TPR) repeat protein